MYFLKKWYYSMDIISKLTSKISCAVKKTSNYTELFQKSSHVLYNQKSAFFTDDVRLYKRPISSAALLLMKTLSHLNFFLLKKKAIIVCLFCFFVKSKWNNPLHDVLHFKDCFLCYYLQPVKQNFDVRVFWM